LDYSLPAFVRSLKFAPGESTIDFIVFYSGDIFVHSKTFGKHLKPYISASDDEEDFSNGKVKFVYRLSWIRAYSNNKIGINFQEQLCGFTELKNNVILKKGFSRPFPKFVL
jgi:hypothetical protein